MLSLHLPSEGLPLKPAVVRSPFIARGLGKTFGTQQVLDQIDLRLSKGRIYAIVGENGAGKSSLMKILSGAMEPDRGTMEWCAKPYEPKNPAQALSHGIAMVYQELSLALDLSVAENLFLGNEISRGGIISASLQKRRTKEILEALNHSEVLPHLKVGDLSPGARQLVEIGRALALKCDLLILDEPTSSLNQQDCSHLFELLRKFRIQGKTIIYISHFLEEVEAIADEVIVLRDGKITLQSQMSSTTRQEILRHMVGREINQFFPHRTRPATGGPPLFSVQDLALQVGAPKNSLQLYPGEILGIFGLVGSGRTPWLRAIFGLESFHSGNFLWDGRRFDTDNRPRPEELWHRKMGFVSEDRRHEGLAATMSLEENMALSHFDQYASHQMLDRPRLTERCNTMMQQLRLAAQGSKQNIDTLSGGNQQKVALGRLLDQGSRLWLLDEPTRGIDVAAKADIYQGLHQWLAAAPQERGILMVGSYLPELMGLCDRIAVMVQGRLGPFYPQGERGEAQLISEALGEAS